MSAKCIHGLNPAYCAAPHPVRAAEQDEGKSKGTLKAATKVNRVVADGRENGLTIAVVDLTSAPDFSEAMARQYAADEAAKRAAESEAPKKRAVKTVRRPKVQTRAEQRAEKRAKLDAALKQRAKRHSYYRHGSTRKGTVRVVREVEASTLDDGSRVMTRSTDKRKLATRAALLFNAEIANPDGIGLPKNPRHRDRVRGEDGRKLASGVAPEPAPSKPEPVHKGSPFAALGLAFRTLK